MRDQRGFVLISLYLVLAVIIGLTGALVVNAMAESQSAKRSYASAQALYLAEGGIDRAIVQLRENFSWSSGFSSVPLGMAGDYTVAVQPVGANRRLSATGRSRLFQSATIRSVEAIVRRSVPPNFYDNVIWSSQELDFRGEAFTVAGDVRHGDTSPTRNLSRVQGTVTYDPATHPLPRLSFQQLYDIASAQGNIYDADRIGNGRDVFPDSFWFTPPTDPGDPTTGVPNVNYVTTDLILKGNIGTIGGFFVVVGDVLTNPLVAEDATINGNGQVAGAVYATGDFRVNGGGNGLNVDGGIWAGDEARLNGNTTLTYNRAYMDAIRGLEINADVQVVSWRDLS